MSVYYTLSLTPHVWLMIHQAQVIHQPLLIAPITGSELKEYGRLHTILYISLNIWIRGLQKSHQSMPTEDTGEEEEEDQDQDQ